jgi:hypothetical protein
MPDVLASAGFRTGASGCIRVCGEVQELRTRVALLAVLEWRIAWEQ